MECCSPCQERKDISAFPTCSQKRPRAGIGACYYRTPALLHSFLTCSVYDWRAHHLLLSCKAPQKGESFPEVALSLGELPDCASPSL